MEPNDLTKLRTTIPTADKLIGLRQVKREIASGKITVVVLATDADSVLKDEVENLCRQHSVALTVFPSKSELGEICGIDVDCAVVGLTV